MDLRTTVYTLILRDQSTHVSQRMCIGLCVCVCVRVRALLVPCVSHLQHAIGRAVGVGTLYPSVPYKEVTDHATWSLTTGRIYIHSTALQHNNNN